MYQNRCGNCHGSSMTGASGPAILGYVRYHTDAEVTSAIRERHKPAVALQEDELRQVLAAVRELAGTNPAMATGGFTGRRGGGGGGGGGPSTALGAGPSTTLGASGGRGGRGAGRGRGAGAAAESSPVAPPARGAAAGTTPETVTIKTADGRTRTGIVLAQSELSAVLRESGSFTLLSRDGASYREKAISPKADWTHYDGSLTGNRYSPLELINQTNVQRVGAAWVFPIPGNPRALQSTPVVQDGIMYVTGWNEIYALDATTGRQIWTYSEERHEGILSEGGIGTNRGVTISGDKALMVTDHAHLLA
jgi:alcohol dehydrogenase (cytochrome c)